MNKYSDDDIRLLAETLPNVSMQIRNALSCFHSALEGIAPPERCALDPELDHQSAILQQSYFRLLRLANNLTEASNLVTGVSKPMQLMDIAALAKRFYQECLPHAETLGIELIFRCDEAPLISAANGDALIRILYQLLSNAFKFTPSGKRVTLYCRKEGGHILLTVEDEGCGIRDLPSELLFDRYLQGEQFSLPPHGLGLGLPLARQLAQSMGGQILLSSQESGTSATLSLPISKTGALMQEALFDYTGGFPSSLIGLSDALPQRAFLCRPKRKD